MNLEQQGAALEKEERDRKERRRYALLAAAATIYAGSYVDLGAGTEEAYTGFNVYPAKAVEDAETLLAEIERREAAEAKR